MLKKSSLGIWIWSLVYVGLGIGLVYIPVHNEAVLTRIFLNYTSIAVVALTFIIYLNERVHWYTGITYEQALEAGSERRKAYAFKMFKIFAKAALVYLVLSILFALFKYSIIADIIFFTVILTVTACLTMRYKL